VFPIQSLYFNLNQVYIGFGDVSGVVSTSEGSSVIIASVVSISELTEAAWRRDDRTTLTGSITPASKRFSNFSVTPLKPQLSSESMTC
jgi:hypothetical protein